MSDIQKVKEHIEQELLDVEGVNGVGIKEDDDGEYICVYFDPGSGIASTIAQDAMLDGVRVKFEEKDWLEESIRTLSENERG